MNSTVYQCKPLIGLNTPTVIGHTISYHIVHWVQKACKCKKITFLLFTRFRIFGLWRTLWYKNYIDILLSLRVIC